MKIVHIGIHGQCVPPWIVHVTKDREQSVLGSFTWRGITVVTIEGNEFFVRPVLPIKTYANLKAAKGVKVAGQSPTGGPGMVNWLGPQSALLPGWFLSAIAGVLAAAVAARLLGL